MRYPLAWWVIYFTVSLYRLPDIWNLQSSVSVLARVAATVPLPLVCDGRMERRLTLLLLPLRTRRQLLVPRRHKFRFVACSFHLTCNNIAFTYLWVPLLSIETVYSGKVSVVEIGVPFLFELYITRTNLHSIEPCNTLNSINERQSSHNTQHVRATFPRESSVWSTTIREIVSEGDSNLSRNT